MKIVLHWCSLSCCTNLACSGCKTMKFVHQWFSLIRGSLCNTTAAFYGCNLWLCLGVCHAVVYCLWWHTPASQSWTISKDMEEMLDVCENRRLRKTLQICTLRQDQRTQQTFSSNWVRERQLKWYGHMLRMKEERITRSVYQRQPSGNKIKRKVIEEMDSLCWRRPQNSQCNQVHGKHLEDKEWHCATLQTTENSGGSW